MSTPKGKRGFFYDEWISPDNGWLKIHSNVEEAHHLKPAFLARQRSSQPQDVFREEYYCEFRDPDGQLFPTGDIDAAFTDDFGPIPTRHHVTTLRTTELRYFLGIDLGQRQDHSAIAVLKRHTQLTGDRDPVTYKPYEVTTLVLSHIERLPLNMPYPELIWKIKDLLANPNIERDHRIAIDATGVGGPFLDFLRQNGVNRNLFAVSITSGETQSVQRNTDPLAATVAEPRPEDLDASPARADSPRRARQPPPRDIGAGRDLRAGPLRSPRRPVDGIGPSCVAKTLIGRGDGGWA